MDTEDDKQIDATATPMTNEEDLDAVLNEFGVGDIRTAHREQQNDVSDLLMDMIHADMCGGQSCSKSYKIIGEDKQVYGVQFLADNLPAVQFVSQFYLELIIHGGLVARDEFNQKKLDAWLAAENYTGQTNGNVIREALHASIIYGYSGLRKIGDTVSYVPPQDFRIWKAPALMKGGGVGAQRPIPGIKRPLVYEIKYNGEFGLESKEDERGQLSFEGKQYTLKALVNEKEWVEGVDGSFFADDDSDGATVNTVFVTADNFCHLRHSDEGTYGRSPLTKDRIRTTMFVDYGRNVIDEIANDGTDYMMYLKARGVAGSSLTSMISASSADVSIRAAADPKQVKSASEKQMEVARSLARKLKRTNKTRFAIISQDWVEKIEKLEGTVRLPDYISILNDGKGVVADIYGIPAMLAGSSGGGWSTGMSALIPFTMERTIKPFQQRYAEQLSGIIRDCAGIKGNIKFKEIDWSDLTAQAELDKIKSEIALNYAKAGTQESTTAKTNKETKLLNKEGVNGSSTTTTASSTTKTKKSSTA